MFIALGHHQGDWYGVPSRPFPNPANGANHPVVIIDSLVDLAMDGDAGIQQENDPDRPIDMLSQDLRLFILLFSDKRIREDLTGIVNRNQRRLPTKIRNFNYEWFAGRRRGRPLSAA